MNQTPQVPSADDALREINGVVDDYSRRASLQCTQGGARSETYREAAGAYSANGEKLHGDCPPATIIAHEKPEHVLMCHMAAAGKTRHEIAELFSRTPEYIGQIMRQPWFRKRFLRITAECGKNQVEAFLAGETINSLETLVEIRDDTSQKGPTRVSAANSILDRALGKPTQHVETENHNFNHKVAENGSELDRQLAAAEEELKSLGQSSHSGPN